MLKRFAILAAIGSLALSACSSKTDASEQNFAAALKRYYDAKGGLCLNAGPWPVDLNEFDRRLQERDPTSRAGKMAALEAAGLVKYEDIDIPVRGKEGNTGATTKGRRYTLTNNALLYATEKDFRSIGLDGVKMVRSTDLCWGKMEVDKIVKWEGPVKLGDYQEAKVQYTVKIANPADWAKLPAVQAAYPGISHFLAEAGTMKLDRGVKLTSAGWEAKGLD